MLHVEVWNTLEKRYLYDRIKMEKTLEMQKSVEDGRMTTPYEPGSIINRGALLPLAIPWHKGLQVGDGNVTMYCSAVMVGCPHK